MQARGPGRCAISFPQSRDRLHVMPTSTGYEIATDSSYSWNGRQRGRTPFSVVQCTLSGAGHLQYERNKCVVGLGETMLVVVPHQHRYWIEDGEIAEQQARAGAKVALLARTSGESRPPLRRSPPKGEPRAYATDIVDRDAVETVFATIERDLGPVSLLTNNAGSFTAFGPIWSVDPDAWWRDIEVNVRGTFHCCRAAIPRMLARKRGRVINMVGGGTATSFPNGSGYATSKAGLLRFTECVSDTLTDSGVLVFAMDPGLVRTAMTELQLTSDDGRRYLTDIPRLFDEGVTSTRPQSTRSLRPISEARA